jgi:hypothetical protein
MKKCRKCNEEKETNEYHKWKVGKDGLSHYCKECVSKDRKEFLERNHSRILDARKEHRKNDPERFRKYTKKSYERYREKYIEKQRIYNEKNRQKINEKQRKYNEKNRDRINEKQNAFLATEKGREYSLSYYYETKEKFQIKRNARNKLRYAVRSGNIMKPEICDLCLSKTKLHGHHEDYSKPLDIKWVCNFCHKKIHNEKGN